MHVWNIIILYLVFVGLILKMAAIYLFSQNKDQNLTKFLHTLLVCVYAAIQKFCIASVVSAEHMYCIKPEYITLKRLYVIFIL